MISQLRITIEPSDYPYNSKVSIVVQGDFPTMRYVIEVPKTDFISNFDWLMEEARIAIKRLAREQEGQG